MLNYKRQCLAFLSADTSNIDPTDSIVAVGAVIPQIDVSILLPSTQPSSYPVPSSPTLPLRQGKCFILRSFFLIDFDKLNRDTMQMYI